jgi:type IX secretion system PorP/SprF family membrane protein
MIKVIKICLIFMLIDVSTSISQTIINPQINNEYINLNPAQTALYSGLYRFNSSFLTPTQKNTIQGFKSTTMMLDAPLSTLNKSDWVGAGISLYHDNIGSVAFNTSNIGISTAYHRSLDRKMNVVLSAGIRINYVQKNIDRDKLIFLNDLQGVNSGIDQLLINIQNRHFFDISIGTNLRSRLNNATTTNLGITIENLLTPQSSLTKTGTEKIPRRYSVYGSLEKEIQSRYVFNPIILTQVSTEGFELNVNLLGGIKIDVEKNIQLKGGLGYQLSRNFASFIVGMDYGNVQVGLSYDIPLSNLSVSPTSLGLNITYIGRKIVQNKPARVILCPRY